LVEASLVTLDSAPDVAGGLVRFDDAKGVKRALAAAVREGDPQDPPASLARAVGLETWVGEFRDARPGPQVVQSRIDEWFAAFEAEEERKARALKAAAAADDGWTVVEAKRGRRKTTDDEGTAVGGIRAATADERRKEGLQPKENFYRWGCVYVESS
jgi:ribosomal RNA-processing protein 7